MEKREGKTGIDVTPFDARAYLEKRGLREGGVYKFQPRGNPEQSFHARVQVQSLMGPRQKIVLEQEDGTTSALENLDWLEVNPVVPEIKAQVLKVLSDRETRASEDLGY